MKTCAFLCPVFLLGVLACSSSPPAPEPKADDPGKAGPDVEKVVRSLIAQRLRIKEDAVDMKRPLSDPPLRADELDVVELVVDLEEHLRVDIPDAAVEKYGGFQRRQGMPLMTPADLVAIGQQALALSTAKKK